MKLSTLLLSSAALVVAGSAFAADLPAKKGAPAAKAATGCPAFGAGFFQIPGGDNCIAFSGYVRYEATGNNNATAATTAKLGQAASLRLNVDARSNTDIGVLRSYGRINGNALNEAYLQFGGLTAGLAGSLFDVAGTGQPSAWGTGLGAGDNTVLQYSANAGSATVSVGLENALSSQAAGGDVPTRPDVVAKVDVKAGAATITFAGVSHEAKFGTTQTASGYAGIARIGANMGGASVAAWAALSRGATAYTTGASTTNVDVDTNGNVATGNNYGGEVGVGAGAGTFYVGAAQSNYTLTTTNTTTNSYSAAYAYSATKGLTITPAFVNTNTTGGTASNIVYLRIQRDF